MRATLETEQRGDTIPFLPVSSCSPFRELKFAQMRGYCTRLPSASIFIERFEVKNEGTLKSGIKFRRVK